MINDDVALILDGSTQNVILFNHIFSNNFVQ